MGEVPHQGEIILGHVPVIAFQLQAFHRRPLEAAIFLRCGWYTHNIIITNEFNALQHSLMGH